MKSINFFPPRPNLSKMTEMCLGTKSRTLGDALILTTLPEKLKAAHPGLRISIYPRGFNTVVFDGNPAVSGASRLPNAVYGDDCNWDKGHLIQLKERFFDLPLSNPPAPRIFLSEKEDALGRSWLEQNTRQGGLPLVILHTTGKTYASVCPTTWWEKAVAAWRGKFRFVQVGASGQGILAGIDAAHQGGRGPGDLRRMFSILKHAVFFIGVDSGPMHVARAFERPSLIYSTGWTKDFAANRNKYPWFFTQNRTDKLFFLYEGNTHVAARGLTEEGFLKAFGDFLAPHVK